MPELILNHPIFIGFKASAQIREKLESLEGSDKNYISPGNSGFLRVCEVDGDLYIGKLVDDRLTTDRVEDIRRNVVSIVRRVWEEVKPPANLQIIVCRSTESGRAGATGIR